MRSMRPGFQTSRLLSTGGSVRFDPRFFASLRMTLMIWPLNINSHRHRAGNVLPAGAFPKFSTAEIVVGHQDNRAHNANPSQSVQTFLHQTLTHAVSAISAACPSARHICSTPGCALQIERRLLCRRPPQPRGLRLVARAEALSRNRRSKNLE